MGGCAGKRRLAGRAGERKMTVHETLVLREGNDADLATADVPEGASWLRQRIERLLPGEPWASSGLQEQRIIEHSTLRTHLAERLAARSALAAFRPWCPSEAMLPRPVR